MSRSASLGRTFGLGVRAAILLVAALASTSARAEPRQDAGATVADENLAEVAAPLDPAQFRIGEEIADLEFVDLDGRSGRLSDYADRKALVVVVRDVGCPVSKKYGLRTAGIERDYASRAVAFLYVDFSAQDSVEECRAEVAEYGFQGRYVRDQDGRFGSHLRARTTTDVFVLDQMRKLRYRGAIDDQMGRGVTKPEPTREFLKSALDAILSRKRVADAATTAPGCLLREFGEPKPPATAAPAVSWHGRIRDVVERRCQECHRPGGAGPFALLELADVEGRAAMIQRVVTDRIMPPWYASPASGPFRDDLRLADDERLDLLRFLQSDCPEGDAPAEPRPPRTWTDEWKNGTPDLVIEASEEKRVPATGVLDYVRAHSDFVAKEDFWVQAIEVRPRCPEVVHHLAFHSFDPVTNGMSLFDGYLPGKPPTVYPPGVAKLVKKGTRFGFRTHYTPNGKPCVDRVRAGLVLAKERPRFMVTGGYVRETKFTIPPGVKDFTIVAERKFENECDLFRFIPHMHLRGRSSKVEVLRPDADVLSPLEIPRWNPDWQFAYELTSPIHIPPGTVVRVTSVFDNSADNPLNPDATKQVQQGPQIWDEMAEAYVEWLRPAPRRGALAPEKPEEPDRDEQPDRDE
jgi:hypothetical protein